MERSVSRTIEIPGTVKHLRVGRLFARLLNLQMPMIKSRQAMHKLPTTFVIAALLCARIADAQLSQDGNEFFEKKIRPLLASKCYTCHSEKIASSGLRLDFKVGLERGGNRGTAIIPGDPDGSLLIKAISYLDPQLKMPPGGRLSTAERADLREWIRMGAPDPRAEPSKPPAAGKIDLAQARKFWAFQ